MNRTLEICAETPQACLAANEGGADRIELCSALIVGGLTPSHAFIREAVEGGSIPVYVLLRPRGGDFLYSDEEFQVICRDLENGRRARRRGVRCRHASRRWHARRRSYVPTGRNGRAAGGHLSQSVRRCRTPICIGREDHRRGVPSASDLWRCAIRAWGTGRAHDADLAGRRSHSHRRRGRPWACSQPRRS